ncbi:hypothetical protein [Halarchaeum nitratireducens]|uniref:ASCH domain-containing protein n=1 Tax=Halarchaeum nitratireducens TaxID=489913 RepID=A0A830GDY2_9EURY|nr:hypothetical protein [Halarchaeum nitratireducens]GGN25365.1 hypothetical protein GCM10009021_29180 [Halarchaeum nitratireducens]
MDVLLSIKPEFAEKILGEEKRYEFRKTRFSDPSTVDTVFMYASAPVQKIVGSFTLNGIAEGTPAELWRDYGPDSGITDRSRFMDYFEGAETGYAIEVSDVHRLSNPIDPQEQVKNFRPPVSFQYIRDEHQDLFTGQAAESGSD